MEKEKPLLPIRVVSYSREFSSRKTHGGGTSKVFELPNFEEHKKLLIEKIDSIEDNLSLTFKRFPLIPAVLKVDLRKDAIAKSHRPRELFVEDTPIIGSGKIGRIYVSTNAYGLKHLKKKIQTPNKGQFRGITTIENISVYNSEDRLKGLTAKQLEEKASRRETTNIKITLFDHHNSEININILNEFISFIREMKLDLEDITKYENFHIWRIKGLDEKQIQQISNHPSVKEISYFPEFKIILPKELSKIEAKLNKAIPIEGKSYPGVGQIDTGISNSHPFLSYWVLDKVSYVPTPYVNNNHGSMVGSILCMAQQVNDQSICPDEDNLKLVDVELIPNADPDFGQVDTIDEDQLIERLKADIPRLSEEYGVKIWNMSASFSVPCIDDKFSSLAVFLDKFQDENDIVIVLPSGNINSTAELRKWPCHDLVNDTDRLQQPGDSVRAVTVGALACKEKTNSFVKINEPACYSCRGPGPSYQLKPDLTHYSGNLSLNNGACDFSGQGINVLDKDGTIVETGGTSFSAPLVARTLALLHHNIVPSPSSILIKALTVHNSYYPKDLGVLRDVMHYAGFGMPTDVNDILHCTQNECTLIFEHEIFPGAELTYPFVWPKSLIDSEGNCRGKVKITLVAEPPLDDDYGAEYIRANISAQLQSFKPSKNDWHGELQETPSTRDLKELYEENLIENYWKWKPIKKYEKTFFRAKAKDWRIKVYPLLRDDVPPFRIKPIKFALIFTISDPEKNAPVYNEVVLGLKNTIIVTNEIQIRSRIRQKINS